MRHRSIPELWWCWFENFLPVYWMDGVDGIYQYTILLNVHNTHRWHTKFKWKQTQYNATDIDSGSNSNSTKFAWLISNCNIRLDCQNIRCRKNKSKTPNDNQNNGIVACIFVAAAQKWVRERERIRRKEIKIRAILPCAKWHWQMDCVLARVQSFFHPFRRLLWDCNRWFSPK